LVGKKPKKKTKEDQGKEGKIQAKDTDHYEHSQYIPAVDYARRSAQTKHDKAIEERKTRYENRYNKIQYISII